jgi:hypothetical protein
MANQSSQVKWSYIYPPRYNFFFLYFLTTWYISNTLAIHKLVSILFNIIKSKDLLIRSASNNLCHNHKWPIKATKQNGAHIWKWPIKTAMSSGVKLHLMLGMIIYHFSKIMIVKNTGSISTQVRFWNKKYQYQ